MSRFKASGKIVWNVIMKINSTTLNALYPKSKSMTCQGKVRRENSQVRQIKAENKNDQINTTIKKNSDGRVSFKGGTPFLHKAANFASYNPLVAEALFALIVTCGLRPLTIMATAKNDEDKQKCSYQAAKSISSGLVGLATTALVGTPIAAATKAANNRGAFNMPQDMRTRSLNAVNSGIDALSTLLKKLVDEGRETNLANQISSLIEGNGFNISVFKKPGKSVRCVEKEFKSNIKRVAPEVYETVSNAIREQKVLNNYAKTGKNVADKLLQPIFMPLRATITIALVPVLLGLIGKSKPVKKEEKPMDLNPYQTMNLNMFQSQNEKNLFKSFAGVANHEN